MDLFALAHPSSKPTPIRYVPAYYPQRRFAFPHLQHFRNQLLHNQKFRDQFLCTWSLLWLVCHSQGFIRNALDSDKFFLEERHPTKQRNMVHLAHQMLTQVKI
jgi:hypothetical protein